MFSNVIKNNISFNFILGFETDLKIANNVNYTKAVVAKYSGNIRYVFNHHHHGYEKDNDKICIFIVWT